MKEVVVHKVKNIGESETTLCGLRHINNFVLITQEGKITCKKCLKELGE